MPNVVTPQIHAANVKKTAQRHLEFIRKTAIDSGVRYTGHYVMNDFPAEAIVKAARKYKCDLIHMGTNGRSGLSKLLLGSQTSRVLVLTRIPVLVHR